MSKRFTARAALISAVSMIGLTAAFAQTAPGGPLAAQPQQAQPGGTTQSAQATASGGGVEEIVVTAQRAAQSLQDVPIAVSAFTNEALERQQINNTSQLQLSLPNITFTKGNFSGANLTIRGIGSPAVATSGDAGVGIHYNDAPIGGALIFETEYFDLERLEVLRGPQGTLFGRNATGGVMNFITAKAVTGEFQARGELEYGNYNAFRGFGMVNVPLGDKLALRVAGQYIRRDGYTTNIFPGNEGKFDDREQYAIRGSLRFRPTDRTTVDLIGYYFKEDDNRMRIQKQVCNTDPTAILGCTPDIRGTGYVNGNATLGTIVQSREFTGVAFAGLRAAGIDPTLFANYSVYTPVPFGTNPADVRTVSTNFTPTYKADEKFGQLKFSHEFDTLTFAFTGSYHESSVSARQDYNNVTGPAIPPNPFVRALLPQMAARIYNGNNICVSNPSRRYSGVYGGDVVGCFANPTQFDESNANSRTWSTEALVSSSFDGPFNFRLGGIYISGRSDTDYFVVSNGLDYGSGLIGGISSLGTATPLFSASPFFNSETERFTLKSYGIFGEVYWQMTDTLKLTLGARYSNDKKRLRDRQYLFNTNVPIGTANAEPILAQRVDADVGIPGQQPFRVASLNSDAITGRVVLDWKPETSFSDDTLVYASYSRGYKPGGINPPFDPSLFQAPATFNPEKIDAFEIGTKNRFLGGAFQANLTGFYYNYKGLQISRIINRTSFNDNTDATVWGVEGEFIVAPTENWLFNLNASYLKTKVKDLQLVDVRDPSGGRSDTVIIKDITSAANCVVTPTSALPAGSAAGFVNAFNAGTSAAVGAPGLLRGVTPIPGTTTAGAFSLCSALASTIASQGLPFNITLPTGVTRTPAPGGVGFLPITDPAVLARVNLPAGVPFDLSGNELQNSPNWKVSAGAQYTANLPNDMTAVFRGDLNFVGNQWGRNYNRVSDRIPAYETVNLSVQLNGRDDRWFIRGYVQNLFNNQGITGLYVTDPSSGLFTNIFTLEPRRFGAVAGFKF